MSELKEIRDFDECLDAIGAGAPMVDIPEGMCDELVRVLIGWVQEVRGTPWTRPPLHLPGS